jgi:glycosyltransferase involved in cell wall biosynthesis
MATSKKKVLFVCHTHPVVRPGGAEAYALRLYETMRDSEEFEPVFVARSGPPFSVASNVHEGTVIASVNGDPNQYFFYTDFSEWDWLYGRSRNKEALTGSFTDLLEAHQPDIVHFQHTLFLGYDIIRVTRNTLPDTPIVYSLHELLPICHRDGQMVRVNRDELCSEASPRRCHECFPDIVPQKFLMRKRFIQSQLSLVDQFITPSEFVRERYVDWGIPREKVQFEENGHLPVPKIADDREPRPRNRFGFFGQLGPFKGINVLLRAMKNLGEGFEGHLWVHGANLDIQPESFQETFKRLLDENRKAVTLIGAYDHAELPTLMRRVDWVVVPSIWWENSPLVIQEAFQYGRPVICSDIGGMAEKVDDGLNGLHFRRGDHGALAEMMRRAAWTPGLWDKLRSGIPPVHTMDEHVATLNEIYDRLLAERREPPSPGKGKTRRSGARSGSKGKSRAADNGARKLGVKASPRSAAVDA